MRDTSHNSTGHGKDHGGGWRLGTQGMGGKPMARELENMARGLGIVVGHVELRVGPREG